MAAGGDQDSREGAGVRVPAGGGPLRTLKPPAPLTITAGPREAPEQEVTVPLQEGAELGHQG